MSIRTIACAAIVGLLTAANAGARDLSTSSLQVAERDFPPTVVVRIEVSAHRAGGESDPTDLHITADPSGILDLYDLSGDAAARVGTWTINGPARIRLSEDIGLSQLELQFFPCGTAEGALRLSLGATAALPACATLTRRDYVADRSDVVAIGDDGSIVSVEAEVEAAGSPVVAARLIFNSR